VEQQLLSVSLKIVWDGERRKQKIYPKKQVVPLHARKKQVPRKCSCSVVLYYVGGVKERNGLRKRDPVLQPLECQSSKVGAKILSISFV